MVKSLRKKHLQVWMLWALLLPLGIVGAVVGRKPIPVSTGQMQNGSPLPVVIKEKICNGNTVQLRGGHKDMVQQLVWMNKQMLSVASETIYLADTDSNSILSSTYIGRIESRGNYVFELPTKKQYHFILYDFIHQQITDRINF